MTESVLTSHDFVGLVPVQLEVDFTARVWVDPWSISVPVRKDGRPARWKMRRSTFEQLQDAVQEPHPRVGLLDRIWMTHLGVPVPPVVVEVWVEQKADGWPKTRVRRKHG